MFLAVLTFKIKNVKLTPWVFSIKKEFLHPPYLEIENHGRREVGRENGGRE